MILAGSICALATPLRSRDDALDLDAFGRLLDYQCEGGTNAMVVAGSTGEGAALDADEFSALLRFARARVAGRVPLLAGTGLSSTRKTIEQTRRAAADGADYALVVTPPYVRPTQEGLYRHYCEVADLGRLPVVLYNVPTRTACDLRPETTARLAAHGNIVGIKEAVTEPARMHALCALRSDRFAVFSGDDPTGAGALLAGADGIISVAANVAPALFAALCAAGAVGDASRLETLDARLRPLYAVLSSEPNPIPLKWCLARLGLCEDYLRLPLTHFAESRHAEAENVLAGLALVERARAVG